MVETLRPRKLSEALKWLKDKNALPFAGGTDLMVHYRNYSGTSSSIKRPVLFTDIIEEMRQIEIDGDFVVIGAACTLAELEINSEIPKLIRLACSEIAAPALRNRATMAGNICNASPAGDTLPPLYIYNGQVVLTSSSGTRTLPISDFITGPGQTVLKSDELLSAVKIPRQDDEVYYYRKVGTRAANALTKLSAAAIAQVSGGIITDFRLALGAVAPVIVRREEIEKLLVGISVDQINISRILEAYNPHIRPIDDQRSTAKYRKEVALNLIRDFLKKLQESK